LPDLVLNFDLEMNMNTILYKNPYKNGNPIPILRCFVGKLLGSGSDLRATPAVTSLLF